MAYEIEKRSSRTEGGGRTCPPQRPRAYHGHQIPSAPPSHPHTYIVNGKIPGFPAVSGTAYRSAGPAGDRAPQQSISSLRFRTDRSVFSPEDHRFQGSAGHNLRVLRARLMVSRTFRALSPARRYHPTRRGRNCHAATPACWVVVASMALSIEPADPASLRSAGLSAQRTAIAYRTRSDHAGGNLRARYVIHTVGPIWRGGTMEKTSSFVAHTGAASALRYRTVSGRLPSLN